MMKKIIVSILLAFLVVSMFGFVQFPSVILPVYATTFLSTDFESASPPVTFQGSPFVAARTTEQYHAGSYSAVCNSSIASESSYFYNTTFSSITGALHFSVWIYPDNSNPSQNGGGLLIFSGYNGTNYGIITQLNYTGSTYNVLNQKSGPAWDIVGSVSGNAWHHIEAYMATGQTGIHYYIDGVNASGTYVPSGLNNKPTGTYIGDQSGTDKYGRVFYDDLAYDDTAEPTSDSTPPTYSTIATNSTSADRPSMFSVLWADNIALSGFILQTNNSGVAANTTWTGTSSGWGNSSLVLNVTVGYVVQWREFANDTSNNWNSTDLQNMTLTDHMVELQSNVDGVADVGTHSNFTTERFSDGIYDNLTTGSSGGSQSSFGSASGTSSYTSVSANQMYGSVFLSNCSNGATLQNITWYGRTQSGTGNAKAILVLQSTKVIVSISDTVAVSNIAQERTNVFSVPPTINAGTNYILMLIFDGTTRLFYASGTVNQGYYDTSNSYASPTNPTDALNNNNKYHIYGSYINPSSYAISLEEQWTNVNYTYQNRELDIKMGTFNTSNILSLQYWDNASWVNLINSLTASVWNNITITSYATWANFTIRFYNVSVSAASSWLKDSALIRYWNTTTILEYQYVTQQSNVDSVADVGSHSSFSAEQSAPDSSFDNMTSAWVDYYVYGSSASGSGWSNPTYSFNNNTANGASYTLAPFGTSTYLIVNFTSTVYGRAVRYFVDRDSVNVLLNSVQIANQTGSWTSLTLGTVTYGSYAFFNFTYSLWSAVEFQFSSSNAGSTVASVNETQGVNSESQLVLEEQWVSLQYSTTMFQELCIYTGTFNSSQTVSLQRWTGSTWSTLTSSLNASAWNNMSIVDVVSSPFTIRFYSVANASSLTMWQKDSALIHVWGFTELYKWLEYYQSSVNWTESMDTMYMGTILGNVTQTDMQNKLLTIANSTATSWKDVLIWSARLHKYGTDDQELIEWALDNATMMSNGLPQSGIDDGSFGKNGFPYFLVYDRELLWGFYWANLYNYSTSKWNMQTATDSFTIAWISTGREGILAAFNDSTSYKISYGPRYYDEAAETMAVFLQLGTFGQNIGQSAKEQWAWINNNVWNGTAPAHYTYYSGTSSWECEAGGFLEIASWLRYFYSDISNASLIITDFQNRFLANGWQSYQWTTNLSVPNYVVIHAYPSNPERRLENTIMAWSSIMGIFDLFDTASKTNVTNMLNGTSGYYPAWRLLFNATSNLFNSTSSSLLFRSLSTSSSYTNVATANAAALMLALGIVPINATIAVPVEEMHYEYIYNMLDHNTLDLTGRSLQLGIASTGTIRFIFNSAGVYQSFNETGLYNITFSSDWSNILSISRTGNLPNRIYLLRYAPQWANATIVASWFGQTAYVNVTWTGQIGLSTYIFSTNNSGVWVNSSYVWPVSDSPAFSNATFTLNSSVVLVQWKVYANDTNNLWNSTSTFTYSFTKADIPLGFFVQRTHSMVENQRSYSLITFTTGKSSTSKVPTDKDANLAFSASATKQSLFTIITNAILSFFSNIQKTLGLNPISSATLHFISSALTSTGSKINLFLNAVLQFMTGTSHTSTFTLDRSSILHFTTNVHTTINILVSIVPSAFLTFLTGQTHQFTQTLNVGATLHLITQATTTASTVFLNIVASAILHFIPQVVIKAPGLISTSTTDFAKVLAMFAVVMSIIAVSFGLVRRRRDDED